MLTLSTPTTRVTAEGKPVLRSTKDDRVFVYFADHGGVGLVAMPVGDPVYAQDLIDALRYMWTNSMYKELVFYMEACESGSMFEGLLPTDANIYATTAANSHESSYGTYCDRESSVDGNVSSVCVWRMRHPVRGVPTRCSCRTPTEYPKKSAK